MRTQGAFYADSSHQGGWIFYSAPNLFNFSANLVLTRNALGDYSFNRTAGGAETYQLVMGLADVKRLIESSTAPLPFQEQFGVAAGTAGYPASAPGIPGQGTIGNATATQFTSPTGQPAKGIQVTDVVAVYQVGVANLTAASLSLNRTTFANNVANAVVNVPIDATALPLTFAGDATGPYLVTRAVTTPVFETTNFSDLTLELSVTLANTGTIRLYGLGAHLNFNFD